MGCVGRSEGSGRYGMVGSSQLSIADEVEVG